MGQVLSNLLSILFGRKRKVEKTDEENGNSAVIHCKEVKPIHPAYGYGKTRVSEKDEGSVVIVISDAEFREDVEPFPSASSDRKTIVSEDEKVAVIIHSGAEIAEKIKPTLHVSSGDKITVSKLSKDDLGAKKVPKGRVLQEERRIKHYYCSHKILLVGEGDFSFSACLGKAFESADNMVATSLNSKVDTKTW